MRQSVGCILYLLNEHMILSNQGSVTPKASGWYKGCDRSDNIVLANSGCNCSRTHCVRLPLARQ